MLSYVIRNTAAKNSCHPVLQVEIVLVSPAIHSLVQGLLTHDDRSEWLINRLPHAPWRLKWVSAIDRIAKITILKIDLFQEWRDGIALVCSQRILLPCNFALGWNSDQTSKTFFCDTAVSQVRTLHLEHF